LGLGSSRVAVPVREADRQASAARLYSLVEQFDMDRAGRGSIFDLTV